MSRDQEEAEPTAGVDWDSLPEPVRGRVVDLAASALGELTSVDIPQRLRPVARFVPAKRARVAAAALLAAMREGGAFRAAVIEWARRHRKEAVDVGAGDAIDAATAAVLLDTEDAGQRVAEVKARAAESGLRAERDAALARIQRLESELERMAAQLAQAWQAAERAREDREADLERLRDRLRTRGVELREAREAERDARNRLREAEGASADELAAAEARADKERRRAEAEHARAEHAQQSADLARRSAHEARQGDEVRIGLLLDTLDGVVRGLRREIDVAGASAAPLPADTVGGVTGGESSPRRVADQQSLDRLLALPHAHLIVDGYNVTKTGYPEMPLADQRERLVRQLSALAARTGAETTVVFDGAAVVAVPATQARGVRVLFSEPGVTADDVVTSLVAAEPGGRPLIVASSDQEIVASVRVHGAYPVASALLLERLDRI